MGDVAVANRLDTQLPHGSADIDLSPLRDAERGVVALQNLQYTGATDGLHILVALGLAEAGGNHLGQILLLLIVLVELLDACHLLVVEPVG